MQIINSIIPEKPLVYGNKPESIIFLCTETNGTIEELNEKFIQEYKCKFFPFHYYIRNDGSIYKGRDVFFYAPRIAEFFDGTTVENLYNFNYCTEVDQNNISSEVANKIFILIEGNNGFYRCNDVQYTSLVQLCKELKRNFMSINRLYAYSEIYPQFNNPDLIYFKINEVRSRINNVILPTFSIPMKGNNIYSFGSRNLKYSNINPMKGNDVELLQNLLMYFSIRNSTPTGIYDILTKKQVETFQNNNGLEITGEVKEADYEKISLVYNRIKSLSDPSQQRKYKRIIQYNKKVDDDKQMSGYDVLALNEKLATFAFDEINNDILVKSKIYTSESEKAVKCFQRQYLAINYPDGVVGPLLFDSIMNTTPTGWIYADDATFTVGDSNDIILFVNKKLYSVANIFGLVNISITSEFDKALQSNLIRLQHALGYRVTGILDKKLFEIIKNL